MWFKLNFSNKKLHLTYVHILLAIQTSSYNMCSTFVFSFFKFYWVIFLILHCEYSLYILDTGLSVSYILNTHFQVCDLPSHFLSCIFLRVLIWMNIILLLGVLYFVLFASCLRFFVSNSTSWRCSCNTFFSRCLVVLAF